VFSTVHTDALGGTYYVNTKTGEATWSDPEIGHYDNPQAQAAAGHRRFSQAKKDPVGNTYFVNNKTGESTWDDPVSVDCWWSPPC
jgi:hypothetical protein